MEKWAPWIGLVIIVVGWVWQAARMFEREKNNSRRIDRLEEACSDVPTIKVLLDAGFGGRRQYRPRAGVVDDAGRQATARGHTGPLGPLPPST